MTSLPSLPAGEIWDGVTEHSFDTDNLICFLDGRGRFCRETIQISPYYMMSRLIRYRDEGHLLLSTTTMRPQDQFSIADGGLPDLYHTYDGNWSDVPVNQYPSIRAFRAHAATFAHQLDAAMGHHSLASADEADRLTIYNALKDMIGSAWQRYAIWEAIDPEEIIVGGNNDGMLLWQYHEPEYQGIDAALCGQCDIATFARRARFHADIPLLRSHHRRGIIYAMDRSTTPWGVTLFDVAADSDAYAALDVAYHAALEHYDTVVGAADDAI